MNPDLYNRIKGELQLFLNRDPSEDEIQNGLTDVLIMQRVNTKQNAEQAVVIQSNFNALESANPITIQPLPITNQ